MLFNLIQNAIRHTPADGSVIVRAEAADGGVEVEVADDGDGIAGEDRERVFEPFFRGGDGAARTRDGAGLGLAISRAIVEAHGGRIWLEPAPAARVRCRFTLPAGLTLTRPCRTAARRQRLDGERGEHRAQPRRRRRRRAARHTNGAKNSQIRSVSAFVKPITAAMASTAKIATASGVPRGERAQRAARRSAGRGRAGTPTGEPSTQYQYGRIEATPAR